MTERAPHRCGTIAIIGRPNVGKSTLLNRFLGEKIAIVSPKPETTRERILGILTLKNAQVLFLDTPGIYQGPATLLARHQVQAAREALVQADLILLMTEAQAGITDQDKNILRLLPKGGSFPVFLAINKVDRVNKSLLLPQIDEAARLYPFKEIIPISASKGINMDDLLSAMVAHLPEGPAHYPADQLTDRPIREQVQELIREKTLLMTHEEIPHSVGVLVEEWRAGKPKEQKNPGGVAAQEQPSHPSTYIRATLYVERNSQKGILIGKGGGLLKKVGQIARPEIEKMVGGVVFLDLWVKVAKNWRKDPVMLKKLGYVKRVG
ncbi:MAG: GTPase Era [Candidatus Omnitrophica bacterium]|nr:GTPase Era [Candidatus Omnitrophota bacterium]